MKTHYIKNFFIILSSILHDKESKSWHRVLAEIIYLSFYHRRFPVHYFSRYLYKKGSGNIKMYVPNKILYSLYKKANNEFFNYVFNNKLLLNIYFERYNINLAKILFYNFKKTFSYYEGGRIIVNEADDLKELLNSYFSKSSSKGSIFIKKMYGSHGGSDIFKLAREDLDKPVLNKIFQKVIQSSFLFQEQIQQNEKLNQINPSCINTVRLVTYCDIHTNAHIISGFLRFGVGDSVVDNTSAGGYYVGIDIGTGNLFKKAYSSITKAGGKIIEEHPNTKFKFYNFKIPYFEEIKKMVKETAILIPEVRLIGWDIAIQPDGPVIIEGNNNCDLTSIDLLNKGLYGHQDFLKILQELKIVGT